jgi:hypothetical protein
MANINLPAVDQKTKLPIKKLEWEQDIILLCKKEQQT